MKTIETNLREYGHYINGEFIGSSSNKKIERKNPATGELVATFSLGSKEDTHHAISVAKNEFENGSWPKMSGEERGRILSRLSRLILENAERLAVIESEEVGKPITDARGEIELGARVVEYVASLAQQIHGQSYNNIGRNRTGLVVKEPVGVVGLITPWNYPALVFCHKVPFALAAGCTTVVKPSEFTSGTTLEIAMLAEEAGIPKGVLNIVTGTGEEVGQAIVDSPDVDQISFTGSTSTGEKIQSGSAKHSRKVTLELGGKSSMIVFDDANLEEVLDAAMLGFMVNQGEECCANSRLLLHEDIADKFLENLVEKVKGVKIGNPNNENTQMGALIHEEHLEKVLSYIKSGIQEGARLLTGGKRLTGTEHKNGLFVEPTIFDQVTRNMKIFQEEIFGPVLSVIRFKAANEAIAIANNTKYGLANSIWTSDVNKALNVSHALRSGTVWVNTVFDLAPQLPMGGYKASGFGREMGTMAIDEFMEVKSININTGKWTPHY
ncbi:aldehyde dehydrogenase family protein [Bacillus salipaludis]|uniref:Aldehyde dehydrogenase family protein n=1 Tax=Bacillus salipaludis TaxID=2547811 RepID=A0ABW8RES8_9BACI